jgi:hypothetical protein
MPRLCSTCSHPRRREIDLALIAHSVGYRRIAARFGLSETSVRRHQNTHLRKQIIQSKEARMLASSESLIAEMNRLHSYVVRVLQRGEAAGDDDLVLRGVSQGQRNVETLMRLGPIGEVEARLKALEQRSEAHGGDQHPG